MSGFTRQAQEGIRRFMRERNLTQEELSFRLGIAQSQVSDRLGRENVTTRSLEELADALGLDLGVVLRPKPD